MILNRRYVLCLQREANRVDLRKIKYHSYLHCIRAFCFEKINRVKCALKTRNSPIIVYILYHYKITRIAFLTSTRIPSSKKKRRAQMS